MKKSFILLLILSIIIYAPKQTEALEEVRKCSNKPAVVAVIDTGLNNSSFTKNAKLCKFGHRNFTSDMDTYSRQDIKTPIPLDNHGHGTNIAGLIDKYAQDANYCMVILKYYSPKVHDDSLENEIKAIRYATNIGAKYINFSGGGPSFDIGERNAVKDFLRIGSTFIAAAGNERSNIKKYPYYPASYNDTVISVGSLNDDGAISEYSNWGDSIKRWEYGRDKIGFGIQLSGTSQATAIVTGKLIKENEKCYK